jgi:uncharacterized protein YjbJ (UPF0337 family)
MDEDEIAGAAKELGGNIKSAVGDMTGDAKTQASGTVDQMVGTAQRTYGKIKDQASGAGSAMVDQLDEASAFLGDAVAERPLTSLLVAGAIGYALAMLVRR